MTNIWIGQGRLTADPELRYTDSGKPVANMRLAVRRPGADDKADFFSLTAFGKLAEVCAKHLTKGRGIVVEGTLRQNSWTDSQSGDRRSRVDIWANRVDFLPASKANGQAPTADAESDESGEQPAEEQVPEAA